MKRALVIAGISIALLLQASPAQADVDDFSFSSFDAVYALSTDTDGHAVLRTTETLVADFPDYDQNHGIRRQLVDRFDGHPTSIDIESVTDETGASRDYETETDDDFLDVTIADDDYVYGSQTYVITYTQRDVVLFADGVEDFYWDTNGTGWAQGFGRVTATVEIDPSLQEHLTGAVDSAIGAEGEDRGTAATTGQYTFTADNLAAGENLSFAIGFEPGTFTPRASGFFDSVLPTIALLFFLLTVFGFIRAIVVRRTRLRDAPGRGIIVPEYVPPNGIPIPISAVLLNKRPKAVAAQIIQLAISKNLRVRESTASRKPMYDIEFLSYEGTDSYGHDFLDALFGSSAKPGKTRSLKKTDSKVASRLGTIQKKAVTDSTERGYRRKLPAGAITAASLPAGIGVVGTILFSILALDQAYGGGIPLAFILVAAVLAIAVIVILTKVPLEPKGVEARDYLEGLKVYIDLAEEARLRYLQSPEGAEKTPVTDELSIVKLNEKLLPYAVLFGNEKRWAQEIGSYYEKSGTQPDWYVGSAAFNAAYVSSALGSVASSASSSFSSSSSGSGGGASSGGGGGGGGGGGV